MASSYPDYIDSPTFLPIPPGPYIFRNAQMAVFRLNADYRKLEALCQRYLNAPSERNFNYRPIPFLSSVFLIWIGMDYTSKSQPFGWIHENEVSFWVPTFAYQKDTMLPIPKHIASFIPYLFLDDFYAIALGREVYGFHKLQAQFEKMPQDISTPEFILNTMAFKTMGGDNIAQREWLLSVEQIKKPSQSLVPDWNNDEEVRSGIINWLTKHSTKQKSAMNWINFLPKQTIIWAFLKQFRDSIDSTKACYQAVIEATAIPTQFHRGGFIKGKYQFALNNLESLPISQQLGLTPNREENGIQYFNLKNCFWLDFDFEVQGR